jgi:O-methyltransferase
MPAQSIPARLRAALVRRIKRRLHANDVIVVSYRDDAHRREWLASVRSIAASKQMMLLPSEACQLIAAVEATRRIPGDIAEVGVAYGRSAKLIAQYAPDRELHLFDTFDGLPQPLPIDSPKFKQGDFRSQFEDVQAYLAGSKCHLYRGLFPSTAGPVANNRFSFVHLDVDLYESTLAGLEFFYPRLSRGGILISHDYPSAAGVAAAFEKFLADKPEVVVELCGGYQGLMVKL